MYQANMTMPSWMDRSHLLGVMNIKMLKEKQLKGKRLIKSNEDSSGTQWQVVGGKHRPLNISEYKSLASHMQWKVTHPFSVLLALPPHLCSVLYVSARRCAHVWYLLFVGFVHAPGWKPLISVLLGWLWSVDVMSVRVCLIIIAAFVILEWSSLFGSSKYLPCLCSLIALSLFTHCIVFALTKKTSFSLYMNVNLQGLIAHV